MNVAPTHTSRAGSRLVERLRSLAGVTGAGRVGFRSTVAPSKRRLGVIAQVDRANAETLRAAVAAGADGIEVQLAAGASPSTLADLGRDLGVPLGALVAGAAGEDLARAAAEAGLDWLRVSLDTPAEALSWERPSRFLTVPTDLDLRLAAGLATPLAEAVMFASDGELTALRIGDAMRLRLLAEIAKKPVLLRVSGSGSPVSAALLASCGVDAVLVPVAAASDASQIAAYVEAFELAGSAQG